MPLHAASEEIDAPLPDGLAVAGAYPTYESGLQHSLVVLAMGLPCWLVSDAGGHRLLVEPAALSAIDQQLARYDRESLRWPPPPLPEPPPAKGNGVFDAVLWTLAVLAVFRFGGAFADAGALDSEAVWNRGEWWRVFTALWFHADAAHVLSNVLGGTLVLLALVATLGRLRAWLMLAAASVAANAALVTLSRAHPYRSVGASTAIFAGVGLLTGQALRRIIGSQHPHRWRLLFLPAATGVIVLMLYGAGGERVDVLAHVAGFVAGIALGLGVR